MTTELERWAMAERGFLREEIRWLEAGTVLRSPSGGDVTAMKLDQLRSRLEHVESALVDGGGGQ